MTYFDSVCVKNKEIHSTDTMNDSEKIAAYRVPKDAEYALLFVMNPSPSTFTFKAADNVFGGKDQQFECPIGYYGMYLDLNTFVQRSGEHEGCVVIENTGDSFQSEMFVFVK